MLIMSVRMRACVFCFRFTQVLGQEFFDALPVHQFVYNERGWLEKMVDVDNKPDGCEIKFGILP